MDKEQELLANVEAAMFMERANQYAEDMFGEFGFDTCHQGEQYVIIKELLKNGIIKWMK